MIKRLSLLCLVLMLGACSIYSQHKLDKAYGKPHTQQRETDVFAANELEYHRDVEPILEKRCVVCHSCYDAPCQLRMQSFVGLDRGANQLKVYDGARLLADNLTRLYVDAESTEQWRQKDFYPVLNERDQTMEANLAGSVLYQLLDLKNQHPLPNQTLLPDSFDLSLSRDQQCPKIETFDDYREKYPLWGMPYGLPALPNDEFKTIETWVAQGGKARKQAGLSSQQQQWVDNWEQFLNGDDLRQQLASRYIYEHLFLANLYEPTVPDTFFKIVRSATPPGQPLKQIATRRPFDDPGVDRVYYRLQHRQEVIVVKNHLPYRLDDERMRRWQELFLEPEYTVTSLPGYDAQMSANPFAVFADLPVKARYQFMLDEAQFTIMGFIKGPVCRGQTALNVIQDRFWVMFVNPESMDFETLNEFLREETQYLRLPAEQESNVLNLTSWSKYAKAQKHYLQAKKEFIQRRFPDKGDVTLDVVWGGDDQGLAYYPESGNPNAALTVFRHFDSATVAKGFVGDTPKTAWLIDYPLLERIHYLLVAGFDVYGNLGHQLWTRLYMDFLRMEGEFNFLVLLPKETIVEEIDYWYQGEESSVKDYVTAIQSWNSAETGIEYTTDKPKQELFSKLFDYFQPGVANPDVLNLHSKDSDHASAMRQLAAIKGASLSYLPEVSVLRIGNGSDNDALYSLVKNRSHSNVAHFLFEQSRLIPEEQTLTLYEGVLGDYPNTFMQVTPPELNSFAKQISEMQSEQDYAKLLDRYGVRRTASNFWQYSDWLVARFQQLKGNEAGLLDYNRLENR